MKLKEMIKKIDPEEYVYIGTASSFLIVEQAKDLTDDFLHRSSQQYLEHMIDLRNEVMRWVETYPERVEDYKRKLAKANEKIVELKKHIEEVKEKRRKLRAEGKKELLQLADKELSSASDQLCKQQNSATFCSGQIKYNIANLDKKKARARSLGKQIKDFTDFGDRKIKEVYPHKWVAPLGTTIIIEGPESGPLYGYRKEILEDQ